MEQETLVEGRMDQGRNQEDLMDQRENERIQMVKEIADLEWERYKETNKLKRMTRQTLSRFNFGVLDGLYARVRHLNLRLITMINDWDDLLETDDQGDPIYPEWGMPEYRYSPEGEDFMRKTTSMEETLSQAQEVLIKFLLSLPVPEQIILFQEAENIFLSNLETLKVHYQAEG